MPNRSVDLSSWERSACYPRSTFYPLSDGPPMRNHRITLPYFRTWSTCKSRSQAHLYQYTLCTITIRAECTLGSLRYAFGGDHPSQTTHQAVSLYFKVRFQLSKGWYFNNGSTTTSVAASKPPTYPAHYLSKISAKL